MAKTIVGTFDNAAEAAQVALRIEDSGIEARDIQVIDPLRASEYEQRWSGEQKGSGGFWNWLFGEVEPEGSRGFSDDEARHYTEGLSRGAALVIVTTREENVDRVRQLMEQHGGHQVETQAAGERGEAPTSRASSAEPIGTEHVLPVVDEQVKVGKRTVGQGAVRVYSHVVERPVEEHVRLREERVNVERRPIDRPLTGSPRGAFEEQSIELTESAEEPVVQKRARVVEEVVVSKDVRERDEIVRDKARRTEVTVQRTSGSGGFAAIEPEFRQHWTRAFAAAGLNYEECSPAYQYGYDLASDTRNSGNWTAVEGEAQRRWEQHHPGTWQRFKDAIRYAWERGRREARAA
jgi:uncharacterized protein (TIGR02271 family)